MTSNNGPYVFISYAHYNEKAVLPVLSGMISNNINIWYDNGIEAGSEWPEYIAEKIMECDRFICFISNAYLNSHNCKRELNFAISQKKEILAIFLEKVELTAGMKMQLGSYQALFYERFENEQKFIQNLCRENFLNNCKIIQPKKEAPVNIKSEKEEAPADIKPIKNDSKNSKTPNKDEKQKKSTNVKTAVNKESNKKNNGFIKYSISLIVLALLCYHIFEIFKDYSELSFNYKYSIIVFLCFTGILFLLNTFFLSFWDEKSKLKKTICLLYFIVCCVLIGHYSSLLIVKIPVLYKFLSFISITLISALIEIVTFVVFAIVGMDSPKKSK